MDNLLENCVRRERQRKHAAKQAIQERRAALKTCTLDDIRMAMMPYYEALLLTLEEKGYSNTINFIRNAIDFQTQTIEKAGPASMLWTAPRLRDSKYLLKTISDNLNKATDYRNAKNYTKECEILLKISSQIAFSNSDWWWLGEQLLLHSIRIAKGYPSLRGKYEALSRYVYGKFLVENINEFDAAYDYLLRVLELCAGSKWSLRCVFPDDTELVYIKANYLLFKCLMHKAKRCFKIDNKQTIELTTEARKRAADACHYDGVTEALLLKGICELSLGLTRAAIGTFTRANYVQEKLGNLEGVCEARLQLAQAYQMHGDTLESLKTLLKSRDCAEKNNLTHYLGQAYNNLGQYYLNRGEPKKATVLLSEGLKIFSEIGEITKTNQVRNLEAVSTGLQLFPKYIKMLVNIPDPNTGRQSMMDMIDWKDSRKKFWPEAEESEQFTPLASHQTEPTQKNQAINICSEEASKHFEQYMEKSSSSEEVLEIHVNFDTFIAQSDSEPANDGESLESNQEDLNLLNDTSQ